MPLLKLGRHATAEGKANEGHGHVYLRPDNERERCGGPALCNECSRDLMRLMDELHPPRKPTRGKEKS
jgi:hypothetical protein